MQNNLSTTIFAFLSYIFIVYYQKTRAVIKAPFCASSQQDIFSQTKHFRTINKNQCYKKNENRTTTIIKKRMLSEMYVKRSPDCCFMQAS